LCQIKKKEWKEMEEKGIIGPKFKLYEIVPFFLVDAVVCTGIGVAYAFHLKYKIFYMAKDVLLAFRGT